MQSSVTSENNWLRSWTNDLYLWYSEVPDLNPASYGTDAYFELLKTTQITPSGADKDRFHFTMSTADWESFSQSGTLAGYGAQFFILEGTPPRRIVVAFTEPNSPAANAGVVRGDEVLSIDGVDAINANSSADVYKLNAGLSPATIGEAHDFTLSNSGVTRQITITSANVTSTPVQNVQALATPSGNVGYLLFNDHIATAESQLIDAVNTLKSQAIVDLVLDVRYNGGGYLDIASELAYMIAGSSRTAGQTFERIISNDKHPTTDPVTGAPLIPTPFHTETQGFSPTTGIALPTLDLQRVYVLTTSNTCSASESIINSLRGVDVQVIQIGTTTCGKPYGFYPEDNCGTTYFSVQFKGVNAKDFGDYPDGFSPQNTQVGKGVSVEGCSVADDFDHVLGSDNEAMLSAALDYRMGFACPTPAAGILGIHNGYSQLSKTQNDTSVAPVSGLLRPAWRENRIMRPPGP
jgi:C-terminal processing protease CtpA/Prc